MQEEEMGSESVSMAVNAPARMAYSIGEIALAIGVSAAFLRLEIARGRLRAKHLSRRVIVTADALAEYLADDAR
jgi:hypothetical protein